MADLFVTLLYLAVLLFRTGFRSRKETVRGDANHDAKLKEVGGQATSKKREKN